jgi:hypothetical protein
MRGPALGCGFIYRRRRGFAPGCRPAVVRGPVQRAGVHAHRADDTGINPGAFAAEAGGRLQVAGPRPITQADSGASAQATRGSNAETPAAVGAGALALAVAAHLGVAVGRRRWLAPLPTASLAFRMIRGCWPVADAMVA